MRVTVWLVIVTAAVLEAALGRKHGCSTPRPVAAGELASKVRDAQLVFTGKVTSRVEEGRYLVRVKRLLKGRLDNDGATGDDALARLLASSEERVVDVKVAGSDPRCAGALRVHQTAVFLAKKMSSEGPHERLQLVSGAVALTLHNLDKINAAVKDIVYKPRPPVIEEPCEKTYCQFGADCVTRPDGSPQCECPLDCPSASTPVCGTDGVTYSNHCLLRLKACQHSRNIRVQYGGECGARSRAKGHSGD